MANETEPHHSLISNIMTEKLEIPMHGFTIERNTMATNNHVYTIHLSSPLELDKVSQDAKTKPFIATIPAGTSRLVMRFAKPDNNVEDSIRIRNEVAALVLARDALTSTNPLLIPRVFGWDDAIGPGYILEEFKHGEVMSHDDFQALSKQDLNSVCHQLAAVAGAFQNYKLPDTVTGYGGLTFDYAGTMSTTKVIFRTGGPFSTYRDYLKATLDWQLAQSENITALKGWRNVPALRERIDAFITDADGLDTILSKIPEHRPALVHGDLTLPKLLFDRRTNRLTAVIDFDFSHIGSIITEFLYSFPDFQGILPSVADPQDGLRDLMLNGFADPVIDAQFATGKAWDDALAAQGVLRPCTIDGAEHVSNVWWFAQDLMHFHWLLPRFYESQKTEEQIQKWVDKSRKLIESCLEHWAY